MKVSISDCISTPASVPAAPAKAKNPDLVVFPCHENPSKVSPASLRILERSLSVPHVLALQAAEVEGGKPGHFKTTEVCLKSALDGWWVFCRCRTCCRAWAGI